MSPSTTKATSRETIKAPSESLDLTEQEVVQRKNFLEFGDEDVARLIGIHDVARRYADAVIDEFYQHLLTFEDMRIFFRDAQVLEHVKNSQRQYFLRLTQGNYDLAYVKNRLKIGAVHERIGLPVKSYLGMYSFYLRAVAVRVMEASPEKPVEALNIFLSLMKLTFLDISLAIETYISSRERTIREQQEAIRDSEEQLHSIAENFPGAIFRRLLRPDGSIAYAYGSDGFREIYGIEPSALVRGELRLQDLMHPDDRATFEEGVKRSAADLTPLEIEYRIETPKAGMRWLKSVSRPRRLKDGTTVWDGVALDITELKKLTADRDYLAYYDQLTGLPNRTLLVDRLSQALERTQRFDTTAVVVAIELTTLKDIRDGSGLIAGDSAIRELATRLPGVVRRGDTIARIGDAEFLLVLAGIAKGEDLAATLREIMRRCEERLLLEGKEFPLKIAMGISVGPEDGNEPEILIRNAMTALNRVKGNPRQTVEFYSAQMTESVTRRLSIEAELRHAIEEEELLLYYQPIVAARTLKIVGAEALIRWRHPERGLISPGEFIPVAEATGLIAPLGEFALRSACTQMREWQRTGLDGVPVSVNLSGWQLLQENFADRVLAILRESGLSPECLKLELTESTILHNAEAAAHIMEQLAAEGVRFSVDDFGIEHSALSHLSRLPIETLKIDYSFVSQMTKDTAHAALVQAIVTMTHAMGKQAVAEGVETMVQLTYLQAYQCDGVQGFLFSRPVPAEAFLPLLQRGVLEPAEETK